MSKTTDPYFNPDQDNGDSILQQVDIGDFWVDHLDGETAEQDDWDKDDYLERDERRQQQAMVEAFAASNAEYDYYDKFVPRRPKYAIGKYVLSQGFPVPLIEDEALVNSALDDGSLLLRSEHAQDYGGIPGVYSSAHMANAEYSYRPEHSPLLRAFKAGELTAGRFMEVAYWQDDRKHFMRRLWEFGIPQKMVAELVESEYQLGISPWKFVEGVNIKMYRDPHVSGRYHYGIVPSNGIGMMAWYIDQENRDEPIKLDYGRGKIDAGKLIDFYERIRALPRFDTTQVPLLELQQDNEGELHFLQYYKTGKRLNEVEPFEIKTTGLLSNQAHGLTEPEGRKVRIYIEPKQYTEGLLGQGIFYESRRNPAIETMLSRICAVYIDDCYISLKGNHAAASILHQPDIGISMFGQKEIAQVFGRLQTESQSTLGNHYINARVIANGQEAAVESDFVLRSE